MIDFGYKVSALNFFFFFGIWMSSGSSTICWKNYFCFFIKDQLTLFVWVYFWALSSVPKTCVYSFASTTLSW